MNCGLAVPRLPRRERVCYTSGSGQREDLRGLAKTGGRVLSIRLYRVLRGRHPTGYGVREALRTCKLEPGRFSVHALAAQILLRSQVLFAELDALVCAEAP